MVREELVPGPVILGGAVIVATSLPFLLLFGYPDIVFPGTFIGAAIAAYRCGADASTANGMAAGLLGFVVFVPIIAAVRLPMTLAPVADGTAGDVVFISGVVSLGFVVATIPIAVILAYLGAMAGEMAWKKRHATETPHRYFE